MLTENGVSKRILSAVKPLLVFSCRAGYLPFDAGRVLKVPAIRHNLAL